MSVEVEPKTSNDLFERGPKKVLDESTRAVIKRLHEKEGKGIRELARDFSVSRNTIKRCLNGSYVKNRKKSPNQMFLQKHYEQIKQMYYEHEGFCIPLQRTIKERFKFDIGLRMLERFCQPFRKALKNETAQRNRAIRFETQPGDQMQIDYGEKDLILGGKRTRIYFFVSKLGYSRRIFAKAYLNKKEASWLDGIESAFHYFGGLPITLVSDNDRSLLRIDHKENITTFNQGYQHFIDYYGLHAVRTRIRHPRSKGKVESGVKYLKNNALPGKKFNSIKEINVWIEYWCRTISDERKLDGFPSEFNTPKLRFLVEKAHLRPIQLPRIAGIRFEQRKVSADGLVRVDGELYSLDMSFASKEVQVQISDKCITITAPGLPPQTRDRAQQVYKPIEQKVGDTAEQIRAARLLQLQQANKDYQTNPVQRPLSAYDSAIGYTKVQQ